MKKLTSIIAFVMGASLLPAATVATGNICPAGERECPKPVKVWVCKYVGQPGDFETLKDGKNPIEVSENAIPDPPAEVGDDFADAQGHSLVVQVGGEDPGVEACPIDEPEPEPKPETPVVPPPANLPQGQPLTVQQPAPQPDRYAPSASIFGPCGDPRVIVTLDNSQSTLPADLKIIWKHGAKNKRIVKKHTLAPGQIHYTGWLWVRGSKNGKNFVRIRDQYQQLLAVKRIVKSTPWGQGDCPVSLRG